MDIQSLIFLVIGLVGGLVLANLLKNGSSSKRIPKQPIDMIDFQARCQALGIDPEVAAQLPDHKIQAIKIYRTKTGRDLKASKDQIDAWCKVLGV